MKKKLYWVLFLVTACAQNPYIQFYRPNPSTAANVELSGSEPEIIQSAGHGPKADYEMMYSKGFDLIGEAAFDGPAGAAIDVKTQAKAVGAAKVVVYTKYERSNISAVPITDANNNMSFLPYTTEKYANYAAFFSPIKMIGPGLLLRPLTQDEKQKVESNSDLAVAAVVDDSPAFKGNILPGDIITSVDGKPVSDIKYNKTGYTRVAKKHDEFEVFRNGKHIGISIDCSSCSE